MYCELVSEPLNPYQTLEQYDQHLRSSCSSIGASANFIGNISATTSSADSAIFEHISGRGLNYDSARVNDLKADSGIVTTLSGTNLNYDSAVFGIIYII